MKPIQSFLRQNGMKLYIAAEKKFCKWSSGKLTPKCTPGRIQWHPVGTDVRVIKTNDTETFIAKFNEDGTISREDFVILAATDLHFEDNTELRDKTFQMLVNHIMDVKPDLILFNGDVIESNHQQFDAIRFAQMMEKIGIYWAFVFGNHEARAEKEFHKYFLLKNQALYPHCLTKVGDPNLFGYGNYFIHIMDAEDHIKQSICMLDSGRDITDKYRKLDNIPDSVKGYDYLKENQKAFYKDTILRLRGEYGDFKSLMFFHIPLKEFEQVFTKDKSGDYVPTGNAEILYGGMYENIGSSAINSGMFDLIKELQSTQAVFCGHDHVNDFCALYEGVYLVYVQCGGYETYTMQDIRNWREKDWIQGVTQITVKEDSSVKIEQRFNRDYLSK